ncbi:hypothetical protein DM860_006324 [Cuscuta australis]|uniref:Uncharacterized protein n=1 Tax=Cuscuta australis TaxID=267555 RepID=A0A328DLQ0_9ASTE|nr:hypothetical protein DM860_006324 [Cuscuta australis]
MFYSTLTLYDIHREAKQSASLFAIETLARLLPDVASAFKAIFGMIFRLWISLIDICLEKAVEFDGYCQTHQPPKAFIKADVSPMLAGSEDDAQKLVSIATAGHG